MFKNEHRGIPCADAPQNPNRWGNTFQTTNIREKSQYDIQISPKHTNAQRSQKLSGGAKWRGGTPIWGRCKGNVQHVRGPLTTLHNMQKPLRTYRCIEEYGEHMGVCTPLGAYKHTGGIQMYRGHTNIGGIQTPQVEKTCLPLRKVGKTPI